MSISISTIKNYLNYETQGLINFYSFGDDIIEKIFGKAIYSYKIKIENTDNIEIYSKIRLNDKGKTKFEKKSLEFGRRKNDIHNIARIIDICNPTLHEGKLNNIVNQIHNNWDNIKDFPKMFENYKINKILQFNIIGLKLANMELEIHNINHTTIKTTNNFKNKVDIFLNNHIEYVLMLNDECNLNKLEYDNNQLLKIIEYKQQKFQYYLYEKFIYDWRNYYTFDITDFNYN